jgi:hypothetical protein
VLLDGVPMADPMFGSVALSAIAPERLANIRVTRGGGSGAFGSGAVAGTIALESAGRDATGAFPAMWRRQSGRDLALGQRRAQAGARLRGDLGSLGSRTRLLDHAARSARARQCRAAYDGWSVSARGVAPVAPDIELQGRVLAFRDQRTLRFAGADSRSFGEDASIRLVARGPWQVDALAYLQDRGFSNVVISSTTFKPTLDQRSTPRPALAASWRCIPRSAPTTSCGWAPTGAAPAATCPRSATIPPPARSAPIAGRAAPMTTRACSRGRLAHRHPHPDRRHSRRPLEHRARLCPHRRADRGHHRRQQL